MRSLPTSMRRVLPVADHYPREAVEIAYDNGYKIGFATATEQTRQACFEAVCNQCAEGKGHGCNVCFLKSAIMQAEVE